MERKMSPRKGSTSFSYVCLKITCITSWKFLPLSFGKRGTFMNRHLEVLLWNFHVSTGGLYFAKWVFLHYSKSKFCLKMPLLQIRSNDIFKGLTAKKCNKVIFMVQLLISRYIAVGSLMTQIKASHSWGPYSMNLSNWFGNRICNGGCLWKFSIWGAGTKRLGHCWLHWVSHPLLIPAC